VLKPVRQPGALGSTRVVGSSEKLHELLLGVADEERLIVQPRTEGALVSLGLVVARDGHWSLSSSTWRTGPGRSRAARRHGR